MDRTVVDLNIARFKKLLESEKDPPKRQILLKLLAEEEAKLSPQTGQPARKPRPGGTD